MLRILAERLPFNLAVLALAAIGPSAVLHRLASEPAPFSAVDHLLLVGLSAAVAGAAAIALTVVGVRRSDAGSVLLGIAFSTMTTLLAIHAFATPGVLIGANGLVAVAGATSLPAGSALLSLSSLPVLRGPRAIPRLLALQGALAAIAVGLAALGFLHPASVPALPRAGSPPAVVLLAIGMAFFGVLALRAAGTYALTRRRADLLAAIGIVWLAAALVPQLLLSPATLAFYVGHALELLGLVCVGVPVAADLARKAASRPLAGDLAAAELVCAEEQYLGARIRALLVELADKDESTEQHTRRVAMLAVRVGEALGLPPARLRMLAVGGLLHDVGKLLVDDRVLKKPGRLTYDEFAQVKRHPAAGFALLTELGGFSRGVRRMVLDHHERLDGAGYPNGRPTAELSLETRILTVCDVYDALVSDRVYRAAWTPQKALELLHGESGTAFDERCVAALERLVEADRAPSEPSFVTTVVETPMSPRPAQCMTRPPSTYRQAPVTNDDQSLAK